MTGLLRKAVCIYIAAALLCSFALAARQLDIGDSGETVTVLTRRLSDLGYIEAPVSQYDQNVMSAVGDFQTANGLARTGTADIDTQQILYSDQAVPRSEFIAAYTKKYAGVSLSTGSDGKLVEQLQQALMELGYYQYSPDGNFGAITQNAVIEYQRANGLAPTGVADGSTLVRLLDGMSVNREEFIESQCASKGDSGVNVRSIQERLGELGYFYGDLTGTFGDNTERAVMRFQLVSGIEPSGKVDVSTYTAIFAPDAVFADTADTIYAGSRGENVYSVQQRLGELGYLNSVPSGYYSRETETAAMLFCAANGFEINADFTPDMRKRLNSKDAKGVEAISVLSAEDMIGLAEAICIDAERLLGENFTDESDDLFPGAVFARYIYAMEGVYAPEPDAMIAHMRRVDRSEEMLPGDIVIIECGNTPEYVFCIYTGGGNVIYTGGADGIVASVPLKAIEHSAEYVWRIGID